MYKRGRLGQDPQQKKKQEIKKQQPREIEN